VATEVNAEVPGLVEALEALHRYEASKPPKRKTKTKKSRKKAKPESESESESEGEVPAKNIVFAAPVSLDTPNYPFQDDVIRTVEMLFSDPDKRKATIQLPTGSGKTRIAAQLVSRMGAHRVLYIVPSKEIFQQTSDKLSREGISHVYMAAGKFPNLDQVRVILAMSQTLTRRMGSPIWKRWSPEVVFIDEIHKLIGQHRNVASRWECPILGMTATPCRLDGQDLSDLTPYLIQGPAVSTLQEQGYLVPEIVYPAPAPDLEGVKIARGDYVVADLEREFMAQEVYKVVPKYWRLRAKGKRTIAFAPSVVVSEALVKVYKAAGIRAKHVDSKTPVREREAAIESLRKHRIDVLCNVGLFIEGLDIVEVECITLCQDTQSVSRYLQEVGRGLRLSKRTGKRNLTVIDHTSNTMRHGRVSAVRDWQQGGFCNAPNHRTCRYCGALTSANLGKCLYCGFVEVESAPATSLASKLSRQKSRDIPIRICPEWATMLRREWYQYERNRVENGYSLPDESKGIAGYTESKCLRELRNGLRC